MDIQNIAQNLKSRKTYSIHTPSAVLPDGRVVEMVYDTAGKETKFAVFQDGEVNYDKEHHS